VAYESGHVLVPFGCDKT